METVVQVPEFLAIVTIATGLTSVFYLINRMKREWFKIFLQGGVGGGVQYDDLPASVVHHAAPPDNI